MISWSGWKRATLRKFFVAAILSLQMSLAQNTILAQDAKTGSTSPAKPQARSLAELVDAAKAESPIIRNAQLGLESVVQKQSTLDKMRFLSLISRELPVRKKQSQAGLNAASANLAQAEHDLKYAVSYAYISIIYANQQLDVADRGINDLATLGDIAKEIVKTGSRNDVSKKQIDQIAIFLNMFQGKREEGTQGVPRAKAALREALGIEDSSWDLTTADKLLSLPKVEVNKDSIIKLALERRGEIQQAEAGVDAACLEVQAQQYIRSLSGRTFAAGGDIHANILPGASLNEDYKPGALAP
ncbi:MAG: TolC family protein [Planctomycetia bacterium]